MDTIATIGIYCLDGAPPGPPCHLVNRERVLVEHKHLRRNRLLSVVLNPQKLVVHCCSCVSLCQSRKQGTSWFGAKSVQNGKKPSRVSQLFVQCNFPETHWIGPRESCRKTRFFLSHQVWGVACNFSSNPNFRSPGLDDISVSSAPGIHG